MLNLYPTSSLIDKITKINVSRLQPLQNITLEARIVGEKGETFGSHAHFIADKDGEVDVCRDSSLGGSYRGVSAMGLLWSMKPAPGQRKGIRLMKSDVTKPYDIVLNCFDDHVTPSESSLQPLSSVTFQKWYMAEGVKRIPVREGRIRGTLFLPAGDGPFPGVVDLQGGSGGLEEFKASLLASRRFAGLALAYFAYDDLPSLPQYIDLDYIEEAVEWLYHHPKVLPNGIAIQSYCLGSWVAFLLASYRTDLIKAIVAISPWHAPLWKPAYRYKGKLSNEFRCPEENIKITDEGLVFRHCIPLAKESAVTSAELPALTPVGKIACPVLFIFGADDLLIDCDFTVGYILEQLKATGKESLCTVMRFPGAGHRIEPPYSPHYHTTYMKPFKQHWVLGGETQSHALAQEISWHKNLDFLQQNLKKLKSSI